MIEEKQTKTLDALLVSPANTWHLVLAKTVTGLFYCLIAVSMVALLQAYIVVHWWAFILAAICGSLLATSIGLLLGSLLQVRQQLTLWGFALMNVLLVPVFLSMMAPILPQGVASVIEWIPSVKLAQALRLSTCGTVPMTQFGMAIALILGSTLIILATVTLIIHRAER